MLFRSKKFTHSSSLSDLQIALFDAANANKIRKLLRLIQDHYQAILVEFPKWHAAPESYREGAKMKWYANGLMGVAQLFRRFGEDSLYDLLIGDESTNPINGWMTGIAEAQRMESEREDQAALEIA